MNKMTGKIESEGLTLQIRKIGNSIGIILPRDFAARMDFKAGDKLYVVEQAGKEFSMGKKDPVFTAAMQIARKGMRTYRNALAELAK